MLSFSLCSQVGRYVRCVWFLHLNDNPSLKNPCLVLLSFVLSLLMFISVEIVRVGFVHLSASFGTVYCLFVSRVNVRVGRLCLTTENFIVLLRSKTM